MEKVLTLIAMRNEIGETYGKNAFIFIVTEIESCIQKRDGIYHRMFIFMNQYNLFGQW